ncbi:unnamed protein product [Eretmochelys imbricata]
MKRRGREPPRYSIHEERKELSTLRSVKVSGRRVWSALLEKKLTSKVQVAFSWDRLEDTNDTGSPVLLLSNQSTHMEDPLESRSEGSCKAPAELLCTSTSGCSSHNSKELEEKFLRFHIQYYLYVVQEY